MKKEELTIEDVVYLFCIECSGTFDDAKGCTASGKDKNYDKCFLYPFRPMRRREKLEKLFFTSKGRKDKKFYRKNKKRMVRKK